MKILLIGKTGQVSWELQRSLALLGEVIAVDRHDPILCGDLSNLEGLRQTIRTVNPQVVVNAAAYTAVDKAQSDCDAARLINAESVAVLASETAKIKALLIHYSTDYVFSGEGEAFQLESAPTDPINFYGQTKREGELAIEAANPNHLIFRTSWVFASRGKNFVRTMLNLFKEKESLTIVNDQYGAPTSAELLADYTALAIRAVISNPNLTGTYHLVSRGVTTWHGLAQFILNTASEQGESFLIKQLQPVPSTAFVTPAKRPLNSRLSNQKFEQAFNVILPTWESHAKRVILELLEK